MLLLEESEPPGGRLLFGEVLEDVKVIADWGGFVVRPPQLLRSDDDASALCWLIFRTLTRFFIMVRLATSTVRPSTSSRLEWEQAPCSQKIQGSFNISFDSVKFYFFSTL